MNTAAWNRTQKPLGSYRLALGQVKVEVDLHLHMTVGPLWQELAGERLGKAD